MGGMGIGMGFIMAPMGALGGNIAGAGAGGHARGQLLKGMPVCKGGFKGGGSGCPMYCEPLMFCTGA